MPNRDDRFRLPNCKTFLRRRIAPAVLIAIPCVLLTGLSAQAPSQSSTQTVSICVLSLFRPRELVLRPDQGSSLVLELAGQTQTLPLSAQLMRIRASNGMIELEFQTEIQDESRKAPLRVKTLSAHIRGDSSLSHRFWLEVPGKLRRQYSGDFDIRTRGQALEAVVTMPLETAVASVVAAESPPGAGTEALKAQAVAARSFLVARRAGHRGFDFCDTTHCQFLRSPPAEGSAASAAARATQGLILAWHDESSAQDRTLAAMYARSCGGRTRTLREIGAAPRGYPYYAVHCVYCTHHPEVWQRELAKGTSATTATERERLNFNRVHGWGAIPSNTADTQTSAPEIGGVGRSISGRGIGHGVGLCQLGAAAMGRGGATFAQILAHYYPNTYLAQLP